MAELAYINSYYPPEGPHEIRVTPLYAVPRGADVADTSEFWDFTPYPTREAAGIAADWHYFQNGNAIATFAKPVMVEYRALVTTLSHVTGQCDTAWKAVPRSVYDIVVPGERAIVFTAPAEGAT